MSFVYFALLAPDGFDSPRAVAVAVAVAAAVAAAVAGLSKLSGPEATSECPDRKTFCY